MTREEFNKACSELGLSQRGCLDMAELLSTYGKTVIYELRKLDNYRLENQCWQPETYSVSLTQPGSDNPVSIQADVSVIKHKPAYWLSLVDLIMPFILQEN